MRDWQYSVFSGHSGMKTKPVRQENGACIFVRGSTGGRGASVLVWKQPPEPSNHYSDYYSNHPDYYMYDKPDRPGHGEIIAARDRVITRHPKLRVVGAHLGSLEYDVALLAATLDKYPNFGVDTSGPARIIDLGKQDRDKVRAFIIKYADRIMFGTDRGVHGDQLEMSDEEFAWSFWELTNAIQAGWDYYATDKVVDVKGFQCPGLDLPAGVVEKLFYANARKWYPGLVGP